MMKRALSALLATAAIAAAAAPAAAQPYGGGGYGGGYNTFERRLDRFEERLERGIQRGDITRREAFRIRQDIREMQILENRYARGGISRWEAQDLDRRLDVLQQRIRFERQDGQDRGDYRRDDYRRDDGRRNY